MKTEFNQLVQHLFRRSDLAEVPVESIREYVQAYPWSNIGHLLLDLKTGVPDLQEPSGSMRSATLYFNNPLWLELLRKQIDTPEHLVGAEELAEADAEQPLPSDHNPQVDETVPASEKDFPINESVESDQELNDEGSTPETPSQPEGILTADQEFSVEAESETPPVPNDHSQEAPAGGEKEQSPAPGSDTPSKVSNGGMVFEPYHSVDYFASLGIRLQASELGKDKLGQQLKSFTEWIKSMKRLPEAEKQQGMDALAEQSIHRIARISLEEKEIHTEAMAEVWAKQGNREKARAIYQKLSLQNPAKSAYFAAKIKQLNLPG